jgi:hypothetical protein
MATEFLLFKEYKVIKDYRNSYLYLHAGELITLIELNIHSLRFKKSDKMEFILMTYEANSLLQNKPLSKEDIEALIE